MHCMSDLWFGCPNCHLTFYSDNEYRHHYGMDHPKRKFRTADPLESKI